MSIKKLKKAARLKIPRQMPDLETKLLMMLMADRADDSGRFITFDNNRLMSDMAQEVNAVRARLHGDEFVRVGLDNERVSRVVAAYREAEDT